MDPNELQQMQSVLAAIRGTQVMPQPNDLAQPFPAPQANPLAHQLNPQAGNLLSLAQPTAQPNDLGAPTPPPMTQVPGQAPLSDSTKKPPAPARKVPGVQQGSYIDQAYQPVEQSIVDAGIAGRDAAVAKNDADRERADKLFEMQDAHATQLQAVDQDYQAKRDQIRMDAMDETGRWLQQLETLSKQEPNPQRYWQNAGGFSKALWLLGMAFTSGAQIGQQGAGMKPNPVIQMLQAEITQDIEMQKERQAREIGAHKVKGDIMQRQQDVTMQDMKDDASQMYARLESLQKAMEMRATAPGSADDQAAQTQAIAWIQQAKMGVAQSRANQHIQAKESALTRGHQANQSALDRQLKRDLAQIEMDAAAANKPQTRGGFKPDEYAEIDQGTGTHVYDPKTKKSYNLAVTKGNEKSTRDLVKHASEKYNDTKRLTKLLREVDGENFVIGDHPEIESLIVKLGYRESKDLDPRAVTTDKDLDNALKSKFGAKLDTVTGRLMSAAGVKGSPTEIADFLDSELTKYPRSVEHELKSSYDPRLFGNAEGLEIKWTPVDLTALKAEPSLDSQYVGAGGKSVGTVDINSPLELTQAEELEKTQKGVLPPFQGNNGLEVEAKVKLMERSSPNRIKELADAARKKLVVKGRAVGKNDAGETEYARDIITDKRAYYTIDRAEADALEKAEKVKDEVIHKAVKAGWTDRNQLIEAAKKKGMELQPNDADRWLGLIRVARSALTSD